MEAFLPIGLLLIMALLLAAAVFSIKRLLGPRVPVAVKLSTYECGVIPSGSPRAPFKNSFYLVAVLFLLFDVEAAFFFPWALVYRESLSEGAGLLIAMLVYMGLLVIGLVYIFRKDCLRLD